MSPLVTFQNSVYEARTSLTSSVPCAVAARKQLPPLLPGATRATRRPKGVPAGRQHRVPRAQPAREHRCKVAWRGRWPLSREHQVPGREQQLAPGPPVSTATKEARRCKSRSRKSNTGVGTTRPAASAASTQSSGRCSSRSPFRRPQAHGGFRKQPPAPDCQGVICKEQAERGLKTSGSRMCQCADLKRRVKLRTDFTIPGTTSTSSRSGPNRAEMEGWFNNANASLGSP